MNLFDLERREFIKCGCYTAIGLPIAGILLQSCGSIYYATSTLHSGRLTVSKSEFTRIKKNRQAERDFVLVKTSNNDFPICIYRTNDGYFSSLLKCTHRGCELNVGGGIYSCPCHGSEFSVTGEVLEGPADKNLKMFKTEIDNENIYIYLS